MLLGTSEFSLNCLNLLPFLKKKMPMHLVTLNTSLVLIIFYRAYLINTTHQTHLNASEPFGLTFFKIFFNNYPELPPYSPQRMTQLLLVQPCFITNIKFARFCLLTFNQLSFTGPKTTMCHDYNVLSASPH